MEKFRPLQLPSKLLSDMDTLPECTLFHNVDDETVGRTTPYHNTAFLSYSSNIRIPSTTVYSVQQLCAVSYIHPR